MWLRRRPLPLTVATLIGCGGVLHFSTIEPLNPCPPPHSLSFPSPRRLPSPIRVVDRPLTRHRQPPRPTKLHLATRSAHKLRVSIPSARRDCALCCARESISRFAECFMRSVTK